MGYWKTMRQIDQPDMKQKGLECCLWAEAWGWSWGQQEYCKQIPKGINAFVNQGMFLMCVPIQIAPFSAFIYM